MIKLYRARSPLYRRQILQENIRWKALDEIYKIYTLARLRAFAPLRPQYFRKSQTFSHLSAKLKILQKFVIFEFFSVIVAQILMKFDRNFANILEKINVEIF